MPQHWTHQHLLNNAGWVICVVAVMSVRVRNSLRMTTTTKMSLFKIHVVTLTLLRCHWHGIYPSLKSELISLYTSPSVHSWRPLCTQVLISQLVRLIKVQLREKIHSFWFLKKNEINPCLVTLQNQFAYFVLYHVFPYWNLNHRDVKSNHLHTPTTWLAANDCDALSSVPAR